MDIFKSDGLFLSSNANVTLLSRLMLSIFREKHTPETTNHFNEEYDYVIVGSGTAGSVLAGRLSELSCVSVLLLEAGQSPSPYTEIPILGQAFINTDLDWQFVTTPQQYAGDGIVDKKIPMPCGKAVGGTSILNQMVFSRGNRRDYDEWAALGAEGWSYEEVLPYFKKLEDNLDEAFVANGYHGVGGPVTMDRPAYEAVIKQPILDAAQSMGYKIIDTTGEIQVGFTDPQFSMRQGKRCSMAKAYLVPAENRTNLDILPNAMVRKVVIEEGRAVGVEFDHAGATHVVRSRRETILCAGAVNSAKLLMLSGVGPASELKKHNISVVADLPVGSNLQDHYGALSAFEMEGEKPLLNKITHPTSFLNYRFKRLGVWTSSMGLAAMAFLSSNDTGSGNDAPDYQLFFAEAATFGMREQHRVKKEYFDQIFDGYDDKAFMICVSLQLRPKSRGVVRLNSSDPYDPPIIDPRYFQDSRDYDNIVEGLKTCRKLCTSTFLENVGVKRFTTQYPGCEQLAENIDEYYRCTAKSVPFSSSHQSGTVKMGRPQDPTTVVDPQLRVKNVKNLRIIDASIMPVIPSGNTNIPTAMIAEKAADMIKSTVSCEE